MVYANLLLLLCSLNLWAIPKKLLTKQSIDVLRYIEKDGKFYFVQTKGGVLSFATEFRHEDILTLDPNIRFQIYASSARKKIVIEAVANYHKQFNILDSNKIYLADFGMNKPTLVSEGTQPLLELNDQWLLLYRPYKKQIVVKLISGDKEHLIDIKQKLNPFFIPKFMMLNPETILYTDVHENGKEQIVSYSLREKKSRILYQAPDKKFRLELAHNRTHVFWGQFPHDGLKGSSQISYFPISGSNFYSSTTLHMSDDADIGQMICLDQKLYFIKTLDFSHSENFKTTEVAVIDLNSKTTKLLSDFKRVSQILEMDGKILLPWHGDLYVLEGTEDLRTDKLSPSPAKPRGGNL